METENNYMIDKNDVRCATCKHCRYSQFAPAGEACCEFKGLGFVDVDFVCDKYEKKIEE